MHKCSSSSHPCSCGLFNGSNNSFSMLFSMPNHHQPFDEADVYPISSSSSSVDCTLSLGTPSTRQTDNKSIVHHRRSGSCVSNLCWDIFRTTKKPPSSAPTLKNNRGGINGNNLNGVDPLLTRRCTNCDTTSTPLWRNGPRGPKSLCNACGIRYKKEERRATTTTTTNAAAAANIIESNHLMSQHHHHQYSWAHNAQTHSLASNISSTPFGNEFRFIEDNDGESDTSLPFLSWRLNVPDSRPSLVHDYT